MMRRKTRAARRQALLFPLVAQADAMHPEAKREIVTALADLLLEALNIETRVEGGDDESEDHS